MARKNSGKDTPYAGFFLTFEPKRSEFIAKRLLEVEEAAESFSALDWEIDRRELALLSLTASHVSIDAVVLMERMHGSGGTGKFKMRMHRPVLLGSPVLVQELSHLIDPAERRSTAENLKRFKPEEWTKIIDAIKSLRPEHADDIANLVDMQKEENPWVGQGVRAVRLAEQRDAIGMVLDVGDIDRHSLFRRARAEGLSEARTALDVLDAERLHEQDVMRHDQRIFAGLLIPEMASARFSENGREVRVHIYDKKPLETVLGIDLLIYLEAFRSFVLVQYKTMERVERASGGTWSYRIDKQLQKQMDAMREADDAIRILPASEMSPIDWRLRDEAFFFKFCETTKPDARSDSLTRGITMCHSHLSHFLECPEEETGVPPKSVGYENCSRYMSNTQFVDLVRSGWIGCGPQGYTFVKNVLLASQEGGRAAMLAVVKGEPSTTASSRTRARRK
jgi:hypothetical protein